MSIEEREEIQDQPERPVDVAALVASIDKLVTTMSVRNAPALWKAENIGEWLDLSEYTVSHHVVTQPGFPAAIRATGTKECQKRWFADEVIEWARKYRGALPVGRQNGRRRKAA
ncbi:hypothetical protein [Paludibacterium purpuratum]|uniref:Uncharacterized protein n=1 Tax=Paludibacterium purpuratum TaxID=1144873 RepID=A0A4R7BB74_9NEIS|nr:hypothetical protein [Paludibacterium purpuratum]TDR82148.1 hypothetical protein DFP86_102262 [Paludibacterium purpuratum]